MDTAYLVKNKILVLFALLIPVSIWKDMQTFSFLGINELIFYIILKCGFVFFMLTFLREITLIYNSKEKKKEFYYGIAFFWVFLIGLILIWPGNWVEVDEYSIYSYAKNMQAHPNQGLFISVLHIWGLMLYDNPGVIVLLQLALIAFIGGKIYYDISLYHSFFAKIFFLIIYFSLPCLYYFFQPMRTAMYGVLMLLFIHTYIMLWNDRLNPQMHDLQLWKLTVLITLLICIRTEGIFLIFIYPLMLLAILRKYKMGKHKKIGVHIVVIICGYILYSVIGQIGNAGGSPAVQSLITPIYTIMNDENVDLNEIKTELENIDKVISLDTILEKSNMAIPYGEFREGFSDYEYRQFLISSAKLILKYPQDFIKCRFYALKISLGLEKGWNYIQTVDNMEQESGRVDGFQGLNKNMQSLISNILGAQFYIDNIHAYHIFWAFWLPCLITIFISVYSVIKHKVEMFFVTTILLIQIITVALLAPAKYAMYYFPNYLCGWFLCCELISKKIIGHHNRVYNNRDMHDKEDCINE